MSPNAALTIGFSRHIAISLPYWTIVEHGARARARELGLGLIVQQNWDGAEQATTIRNLVQQRVDAIIIAPIYPSDPTFVSSVLGQVSSAGIPLIALDGRPPHPVTSVIRSDDVRGLTAAATSVAERWFIYKGEC